MVLRLADGDLSYSRRFVIWQASSAWKLPLLYPLLTPFAAAW
jgi:hypothetical protein